MKKSKKRVRRLIKLSEEQRKAIQRKANLYAEGNFSKWMRYAALHFVPLDNEVVIG
jgi:hypothetical protein